MSSSLTMATRTSTQSASVQQSRSPSQKRGAPLLIDETAGRIAVVIAVERVLGTDMLPHAEYRGGCGVPFCTIRTS
jgi:hypothetical protein